MPNYAQQRNYKQHKRSNRRRIMLVLTLMAAVLAIVNIVLSAQLSHVGLTLQAFQGQAQDLQLNINQLEQEINTHSSLISIKSKASQFGFVVDYQAIALPKTEPVAYHPN